MNESETAPPAGDSNHHPAAEESAPAPEDTTTTTSDTSETSDPTSSASVQHHKHKGLGKWIPGPVSGALQAVHHVTAPVTQPVARSVHTVSAPVVRGIQTVSAPVVRGVNHVTAPVVRGVQHVAAPMGRGAAAVAETGSQALWTVADTGSQALSAVANTTGQAVTTVTDPVVQGLTAVAGTTGQALDRITTAAGPKQILDEAPDTTGTTGQATLALPPDQQLQKMDLLFTKQLQNVSVAQFYEQCWSEGTGTQFFQGWLQSDVHNLDIVVGPWQSPETHPEVGAEDMQGTWDLETYPQKRLVTFRFERTTHLYTGPPVAAVVQTQYVKVLGEDRCIVALTNQVQGVPFADAFRVQIRWVATRLGTQDLQIQVGMFVLMLKQVLVAGQIKSAAADETKKIHLDLFRAVKKACGAEEATAVAATTAEEPTVLGSPWALWWDRFFQAPAAAWTVCFPFWRPPPKEEEDDIRRQVGYIHDKLRLIKALPAVESGATEEEKDQRAQHVAQETAQVHEALDAILTRSILLEEPPPPAQGGKATQVVGQVVNSVTQPVAFTVRQVGKVSWAAAKHLHPANLYKLTGARSLPSSTAPPASDHAAEEVLPPPDDKLREMNVVLNKVMENVKIADICRVTLSEEGSFHKDWLVKTGKTEVEVDPWEQAPEGTTFQGEWCRQDYTYKRTLKYMFERTVFLDYGARKVRVQANQYFRFEKHKAVLAATIRVLEGAFSDSFCVQLRWVARNLGDNKVSLRSGIFVVIAQKTILSAKIQAAATQEATINQVAMYKSIQAAVGASLAERPTPLFDFSDEAVAKQKGLLGLVPSVDACLPQIQKIHGMYPDSMLDDDAQLSREFRALERKLRAVEAVLADEENQMEKKAVDQKDMGEDEEYLKYALNQLVLAHEALDNIIVSHGRQDLGPQTLAGVSFQKS